MLERSVEDTAGGLGGDRESYCRLMAPLVDAANAVISDVFGPIRLPRRPISSARFGLAALRSADGLARARFETERARALLAGIAAHSMLPLTAPTTAAAGLVLGLMGHAFGWPMARRGSQQIAEAMASYLRDLGGEIVTSQAVSSLDELPTSDVVMLDLIPRQVLGIAGARLPDRYRRTLGRYRYGPGVCKLDWALDGPVPWTAEECARAATVHLGGTLEEIAHSEQEVWHGRHPERPYVLFAQQTPFDPTRAPEGKHTAWAYCHVPAGSDVEMSDQIEAQVERFAPRFRDGREVSPRFCPRSTLPRPRRTPAPMRPR
jgi:phytoene dehydrogenase-like protein